MSSKSLKVANIPATLHTKFLDGETTQAAMNTLLAVVRTCFGFRGKLKMVLSACGGISALTSSSDRIFRNLTVSDPALCFLAAGIKNHILVYRDGGWFCCLLTLLLMLQSKDLALPRCLAADCNDWFSHACLQYLQSDRCRCKVDVDFSTAFCPLSVIKSILFSKPGCALSAAERDFLAIQILKAFVSTVPSPASNHQCQNHRGTVFVTTHEGTAATDTKVFSGILLPVSSPQFQIIQHCLQHRIAISSPMKVALFATSLAGSTTCPSQNESLKLETGPDVDLRVCYTEYLKQVVRKLIDDGVHLVVCQKVVHPTTKKLLSESNVIVIERLGLHSMSTLQLVSGAKPIGGLFQPTDELMYGMVAGIHCVKFCEKNYINIVDARQLYNTLLLCNKNEEFLEELKVVCEQALAMLGRLLGTGRTLFGAGCTEVHLASFIRNMATSEQTSIANSLGCTERQVLLAADNFAGSLEAVATSLHQQSRLRMWVDDTHHHLWVSETATDPHFMHCACRQFTADSLKFLSFSRMGSNSSGVIDSRDLWDEDSFFLRNDCILDEVSCRLNAYRVAFETSSAMLRTTMCLVEQT